MYSYWSLWCCSVVPIWIYYLLLVVVVLFVTVPVCCQINLTFLNMFSCCKVLTATVSRAVSLTIYSLPLWTNFSTSPPKYVTSWVHQWVWIFSPVPALQQFFTVVEMEGVYVYTHCKINVLSLHHAERPPKCQLLPCLHKITLPSTRVMQIFTTTALICNENNQSFNF